MSMAKIIKIPSVYVLDTKVAGVSMTNADGTSRQEIIRTHVKEGDPLHLQPEPDNPHDPNAIQVRTTTGLQIGYLQREVAEKLRMALQNEVTITVTVSWVSGEKMVGVGLRIEMVN